MDKIIMIESSLKCLRWGWLALIPGLGPIFGVLALKNFTRAFYHMDREWNPAKWHLYSGAFLAICSWLAHGLGLTLPLIYLITQ